MMEIVRTFDLPNIKLLAIKFDDEPLDASEVILSQWSSAEFLRVFFTNNHKDYFSAYGRSDLTRLVREALDLATALFEKLYEFGKNEDSYNSTSLFKPLDNREYDIAAYDLQKLKAKGEERQSYFRVYGIKYKESVIITGGAIKLIKEMRNRPHTNNELKKLELVKKFLEGDNGGLDLVYLDIK
jgi:hypothetical protein